ncbi:MAG: hypothetical protein V1897_12265 [Pseudomonadota bacterium]
MSILNSFILSLEILSSVIIFGFCFAGFVAFLKGRDRLRIQTIVADGAIIGMNLKLVGALLKTIELQTWNQLGLFVVIFGLRTLIKRVFLKRDIFATKQIL